MRKATTGFLAAAAVAVFAGSAQAQMYPTTPFSVEVRGGVALPTGDFNQGASTAWGGSAEGIFNVTPMIGVYAGYGYHKFSADSDLGDQGFDVADQGFNGGLRLSLSPMAGFSPYLKGGAVYHKLTADLSGTDLGGLFGTDHPDTDYALGFEVGGGLDFPLGNRVSVTPGASYVHYTVSADKGGNFSTEDFTVSDVKIDVGLKFRF